MAIWTQRLERLARRGLNQIQERVLEFEKEGGVDAFVSRLELRLEREQTLLLEGRHPLLPEHQKRVRVWYARLELSYNADEREVRDAYRAMMRRYHPDRFSQHPEGEALATRLSQELTEAYSGLLEHLKRR